LSIDSNGVQLKKRLSKSIWVAVLFCLMSYSGARAAFQESLWGARPAAMAGAYTALADDANAPAYNPAGISMMTQSELTFTYAQLYSGLNFNAGDDHSKLGLGYLSYVPSIKEKKYGSYAVSWTNFVATNLYREDTFSFTIADSFQFENLSAKPVLSYGTNIKFLRRAFSTDQRSNQDPVFRAGRTSSAVTLDLGVLYHPHFVALPGLKFGAAAQNITQPNIGLDSTDRVPARYSVGVSYQDPQVRLFNPSLDISHRLGRTIVSGAFESWVAKDVLALRFGGNRDQLAGGIGYQFRLFGKTAMRLDYAILWPLYVDGTNGSHRVSITTSF
jgi:hypothetical protein